MDSVSREADERLKTYKTLLLKWQAKINLIGQNTVNDLWERHFEDSLQLLPFIPKEAKTLYDLGTGAGFPGLVLAISCPNLSVTLIESDSKKCAFLSTVSRETGVSVTVKNARIEKAATDLPAPDIATARALAPLSDLLNYVRPWLESAPNLRLIFPKGETAQAEIDAAKSAGWDFDMGETPSKTDKKARILTLKTVRKNTV